MADQRIKGQEVELLLVVDGIPQLDTTDVKSFEVAIKTELLEEGYLGETTDRYDEIFKGVRGRMELNFENQSIFGIFQSIVDRARRRTPGVKINVKATLNFPNGQRPLVLINDVSFGEIPTSFSSRSDYGAVTLEFSAPDITFITA